MSGAQRAKGAYYERKGMHWLRENGHPGARRYLAGDGRQPGDLDAIPGVCIEVKARRELAIPSWLRQVEDEAGPNRFPVLWVWRPGLADPGDWWAITRWKHLHAQMFGEEKAA